jgi:hypothetical protein
VIYRCVCLIRFLLLFMVTLCFCGYTEARSSQLPDNPKLLRQYRQGPVIAVISVSETNITTAGSIQLILDVHAPISTEIVYPDMAGIIAPLSVAAHRAEPVLIQSNDRQRHRQVWELVPEQPGDATIGAIAIQAGSSIIRTEPVPISVTSVLPPGTEGFAILDIAGPEPFLSGQRRKRTLALLLCGMAAGLFFLGLLVRSRRHPRVKPPPDPGEVALQAMAQLPAEPIERIHKLNRILRGYIQDRYHIPALGKTAAELLPTLSDPLFSSVRPVIETGEQIRFSNVVPEDFVVEMEQEALAFIQQPALMEEEQCG